MQTALYHTHQHDYKPTHPIRPGYLLEADNDRRDAWRRYSDEIDEQMEFGELDNVVLEALRTKAIMADQRYRKLYGELNEDVAAELLEMADNR